jgi:hypothetical protein
MLIDTRLAGYLFAVAEAVQQGRANELGRLTSTCPECGSRPTVAEPDGHILVALEVDRVAVVVGCEGYWVINPAKVGVPAPNWQPWEPA